MCNVGLRPRYCWDRGFNSVEGNGYSSVDFVVCPVASGPCDGLITRSGESYRVYVCVCVCVCV